MTCESLLGLEDAMDEFLQSVDLFDDIDVGELDFASKASELLENSDSDSGISVAGEKHMQQLEVDAQPNCTDTDRVLTDVVGSSKHFTPNVLFKNDGCAKYQALNDFKETSGGTFVKISSSNPSIPKFKRITVNVLGGKRLLCNSSTISSGIDCSVPVTGVIPTTSKYLGIPVKLSPDSPSSIQSSNFSPSSSTSSPIKPDLNRRSLGELFSGVNGANEVYEYCGSSSPTDSILQEHLQNVSCTTYSNSFLRNHTHLSPTSLLDMQDFSGPNECIISHTNLERIRKKQERMIKNRQAACLSRLRKKEYLERLEMKFEQLKRENLALWRQNEEWRMRCSQLERCIEDLQSRFPSPTNSEITNSKCRPVELGAIKIPTHLQSNNGVTPTISNKTVSVHAITPQSEVKIGLKSNTSVITHPSSFFESGRSKTISIQNWKNSQDKNVNSKAAFPISMNSSKTFKWDSSSKRLLSNKVDVESHSQLSLHQSSVPRSSVTRTLLTPRRFGSTVTQRSKVIATTSLLAIFGLFTLNILSFSESTIGYNILPALSSIGMLPSGDQVGSQKIAFGKTNSWSSMHHPLTGRRLSIDIKPTQGDILVDDELIQASPNDNFITSEAAAIGHSSNNCGPNKNISCSENSSIADVRQILQGWIERHAVSTSNQSRVYRLLLTSSIHNLKAFAHQQTIFNPSKPLSQNTLREQKPISLPIQHHDSPKKLLPSVGGGTRQRLSANGVDRRILNITAHSLPPKFASSHRSPFVRKYDLQPYIHPAVRAFENLFSVVNRRNDTAYIVFLNRDHFLLPPIDPLPANMKQKMTFLLPAHPVINGSQSNGNDNDKSTWTLSMLQLDCEVMNATLLQSASSSDSVQTPDNQ